MASPEDGFMDVLHRVIDGKTKVPTGSIERINSPTAITRVEGRLLIAALADVSCYSVNRDSSRMNPTWDTPCIILHNSSAANVGQKNSSKDQISTEAQNARLEICIPGDKKSAERAFKANLSRCLEFVKNHLEENRNVCIVCETGKDLSVGVAIAAMQAFFDDDGSFDLGRYETERGLRGDCGSSGFIYLRGG